MDQEKNNPTISIVLPVYNTAIYLRECIESILSQTYTDFECIIIDDASSDESRKIIQKYAEMDSRIRFLFNKTNGGIGFTRNRGIEIAKGRYIANFDSDDIAFPEWLETQFSYLESNLDTDIVGANFVFINKHGKKLFQKNNFPELDKDIKQIIPLVCPIANNTVLIRKKCFEESGLYRISARVAEDYDLWMRWREKYRFYNTQAPLVYYRVHGENSIIREGRAILQETVANFPSKVQCLVPISWNIIKFIILSGVSYMRVFIQIKFQ